MHQVLKRGKENHVALENHRDQPFFRAARVQPAPRPSDLRQSYLQDLGTGRRPREIVHTGVWEATPGETRSIKGETFEFCHILSGVVELTPENGEPVVYKSGDSFVMKPGFVGIWKTMETVRKIYVTVM